MITSPIRLGLAAGLWMAGASMPMINIIRPAERREFVPPPYQLGRAAWYGEDFHGRETASGEIYNMYYLTAAHRRLPLGTRVKVTNLGNGRSVVVRINDRGPVEADGRVIDLSYAASERIGMVQRGVAPVRIDVVGVPSLD